jgi:ribosomal protein S18 acetylase RimI-like enzyme
MTDTADWDADAVILRRANATDAANAADVLIRSRSAAVGAIPALAHSEEDIYNWMQSVLIPHCEVWIAEAPDETMLALLVLDEDWIDQLYVRIEAAGLGIGSRLIDLAKKLRPNGLQLRTFASNPGSQRFYERHGFVEAERNTNAAHEGKRPDIRYVWIPAAA